MSESKGETLSTTAANAPSSNHNQLWAKFYLSACVLLTKTKETLDNKDNNNDKSNDKSNEDLMKLHQKIMITLDTTTKLIFGLGATKKAQVVVHGGGAIELIIALVRASKVLEVNSGSDNDNENENNGDNNNDNNAATVLSKPIVLSSLKAIKTCVLRNPAGRCRCRSAGVFAYLKDVLDVILGSGEKKEGDEGGEEKVADPEDKLLVEQVFTALAAICLGDDLNAVQASTQFKPFMERTKSIHCDEEHESSLGQKIQYLERLFTTIDEEQSELLTYLQSKKSNDNGNGNGNDSYQTFIENINNAEINIRNGYSALQSKNYQQSRNHYNQSLKLISPYIEYTKLFHPLVIEIRSKRGEVCYDMDKADECLVDTTYLLEQERLGDSAPMIMIKVLKLHAKALTKVGRDEEAKESLGKLSILCPEDQEVTKLMKDMGV